MIIKKTPKLGLLRIHPETNFKDFRGRFIETFNKKKYFKKLKLNFVEDDFSINKKNVFRGIHGDHKTWKLFSCIHGKCQVVILNCDKKSKNFKLWESFILSPDNYFQILIPPSYGNSFLVLSNIAVCHYKQTKYYRSPLNQFTFNYKDPSLNIKLLSKKPIISKRDRDARFVEI
jgi:dTDP-4-dehydrorhamnose 3,5-epimerase